MDLKKLENLPLKEYFNTSWILNLSTILFCLLLLKRLPPQIPIYYGLPQGEIQLSPSLGILIPSILSLIFILLNLFLISVIKDGYTKKTLIIAGLATSIFASVTVVKIILLIGKI